MVNQILSMPHGSAAIHSNDDGSHELAIYRGKGITLLPIKPTDTFEQIKTIALEYLGYEVVKKQIN